MTQDRLEDFDVFYQEIPTKDYLNDLDPQIEDFIEAGENGTQGLNEQQVSRLAQDTIEHLKRPDQDGSKPSSPGLFDDTSK